MVMRARAVVALDARRDGVTRRDATTSITLHTDTTQEHNDTPHCLPTRVLSARPNDARATATRRCRDARASERRGRCVRDGDGVALEAIAIVSRSRRRGRADSNATIGTRDSFAARCFDSSYPRRDDARTGDPNGASAAARMEEDARLTHDDPTVTTTREITNREPREAE
jgi:hypothetical protein